MPGSSLSAFDQGKAAGGDVTAASAPNPFPVGSADARNFELGRRFGAEGARERQSYRETRPDASRPDDDEVED